MKEKLEQLFFHANHLMFKRDLSEIKRDVSERSICANLKEMISYLLPYYGLHGYYADVEYNRVGEKDVKQTLIDGIPDNIVCDLIVHSRGKKRKDNLLCIEMKKSYATKASKQADKDRLIALTSHNLNVVNDDIHYVADYSLGIYYEININRKIIILEFYENGELINQETFTFDFLLQNISPLFYPFQVNEKYINKFCFHNVGQGLFYSGSLYNNEYNFIYDCGSRSHNHVNKVVQNYCKNLHKDYIDFLAISHFHDDHISGIAELRKHVIIKRVFLPYLFEDRDLTYLAIWGAVYNNEDNDDVNRIELVNYLYELYYSDNAIVINNEYAFNYNSWVFKFYNKSIDFDIAAVLKESLRSVLLSSGYSSLREIINYGDIDTIKKMYMSVFGNGDVLNDTSLILLHYPSDNGLNYLAYHNKGVCEPFSLLTGDIVFDSALASRVASGYPGMISGIGLIPHHGSINNWPQFYSFFSSLDYYIVSSGLGCAPRFPDPIIAKTLSSRSYIKVNEIDGFSYFVF